MNGLDISLNLNSSFSLSAFQLFCDDYVASSSEITRGALKPKEIPCSEASAPNLSSSSNAESIIIDSLRKEIKVLKAQCLTAIAQSIVCKQKNLPRLRKLQL